MTDTGFAAIAPVPEEFGDQSAEIENVISSNTIGNPSPSEQLNVPTIDDQVEQMQEPWFVSTPQPGPIVAARLLPGGWDVVVSDSGRPLTIKQKNALLQMLGFKFRRHEKEKGQQYQAIQHKSSAEKQAEIQAALRKSFAEGNLTGV